MKIKLHHILFTACLASTAFINYSYAQDGAPDYEVTDSERDKLEKEKIMYSPGEGDSRYSSKSATLTSTTTSKDSLATTAKPVAPVVVPKTKTEPQPKAAEKQPPQQPKDDDSILSFNFLYYIIQKYKLQDIVD
jgi:hypothetical protein